MIKIDIVFFVVLIWFIYFNVVSSLAILMPPLKMPQPAGLLFFGNPVMILILLEVCCPEWVLKREVQVHHSRTVR